MSERTAVIGTGQIGSGMAGRLQETGYDMIGYGIGAQQRSCLAGAGFRMAGSIEEAAGLRPRRRAAASRTAASDASGASRASWRSRPAGTS